MSKHHCVPCGYNNKLGAEIDEVVEVLRTKAHTLVGKSESEFYDLGLFRGAIEKIRGSFSADTSEKRRFVRAILSHLEDLNLIDSFEEAQYEDRFDFVILMPSKSRAVISCTGCLDGNNVKYFTRPGYADEFYIWSMCSNAGADPKKNVWSGIHSRLAPEILSGSARVDGLIVWDWLCGSSSRTCPKLPAAVRNRINEYNLPPPCVYLFPDLEAGMSAIGLHEAKEVDNSSFLAAMAGAFGVTPNGFIRVDLEVVKSPSGIKRRTLIRTDHVKSASKFSKFNPKV